MKRVSDVGRWPLRSKVRGTCLFRTIRLKISQTTFALFAVGLATSAAKADVWVVTYKVAGNNVYNGSLYGGESWASCFVVDPQTGETLGNHWYGDDTMPLGVHFEDRHSGVPVDSSGHYGGLSSHIDGTVAVVLTREDGDGHEVTTNIPATASIKVHGYSHGTYSGTDGGSTINLDIGKAVSPTLDSNVSSDPDNNAATPDVYQHDKVLDSVYLLTKNVPAGQNKVVFEGIPLQSKVESHAGNGSTGTGGGSHHLGAFIEVVPDDRSVSITNFAMEPSYHRTMDGTRHISKYRNNQLPIPFVAPMIHEVGAGLLNERSGDGAITVDSVATWDEPSQQWMAQGTYSANVPGFTAPTLKWIWNGGSVIGKAQEELDSGNSSINLTPFSGIFYDLNGIMLNGSATGLGVNQSTLTLKATDADGVEGENTYTINWHLPYEKLRDLSDGTKRKQVYWISANPLADGGGVSVEIVPAKEFDLMAAIDDVSVVVSATGVPVDKFTEAMSVFKALTNISEWSETAPEISTATANINNTAETFRAAVRERPENISDMTVEKRDQWLGLMDGTPQNNMEFYWAQYDCFVGRVRYHHKKNVLADHYDGHGFASPNSILSHDMLERYQWDTFYSPHNASPVPPTLGDREIPPSYGLS